MAIFNGDKSITSNTYIHMYVYVCTICMMDGHHLRKVPSSEQDSMYILTSPKKVPSTITSFSSPRQEAVLISSKNT